MATEGVELLGVVEECLRGGKFKVICTEGPTEITAICTISGKMKTKAPNLRVVAGDTVRVLLNPMDLTQGKVCWVVRNKQ